MSTEDTNKILDRVKKLLALGESPNEAEASAAVAKAHKLLTEYNLSISDIPTENSIVEEVFETAKKFPTWKLGLITVVCQTNYCQTYKYVTRSSSSFFARAKSESEIKIVGKPHNVAVTHAILDYLFATIARFVKTKKGFGKEFIESYKVGVADTLCKRLRELSKQEEIDGSGSRDLAVNEQTEISAFLRKLYQDRLKSKSNNVSIGDQAAFIKGRQDGYDISLNSQLKGSFSAVPALK